jgi:outer membrane biosynthesis protein TonB
MALALRKEEGLGLGIAVVAHAAIVAVLLLRPQAVPEVQPPERIEVTISDDVALTSTSPQPNSEAAGSVAPSLGEPQPEEQAEAAEAEAEPEPAPPEPAPPPPRPAPPRPQPRPEPKPEPKPEPEPKPVPRPVPKPAPKAPPPKPAPKPAPKAPPTKATPKPAPKAAPRPAQKTPAAKAPATKAPASKAAARPSSQKGAAQGPAPKAATKSDAPAGGSRIGADFLEGVTGGKSAKPAAGGAPAAAIGPAVRSSLASAISRQLKPKWQAPQGPGAEELVTILSFNLNRDGSLAGTPTVVRQSGIDAINRNQAERHAEQAIRAVRLAAPFDLPAQYYDAWKRVSAFRFDKRLSQ